MNEEELKKNFRNRLDELMSKKNIRNDSEIYNNEKVDISQSRFSKIRSGNSLPKITELKMLADYFDVTIDYFINKDSHFNNNNKTINWKDWTYKDILTILIEMYEQGAIKLIEEYIPSYDGLILPVGIYGVLFSNSFWDSEIEEEQRDYISNRLIEWSNLSKVLNESNLPRVTIENTKKAFIQNLYDGEYYDLPF